MTADMNTSTASPERMPAIYLSHGAPPLADDPIWPGQLAAWSADLPKPKAILMVSAHWEEAPLALGATTTVPLVYDFWGFPQHYYEVTYRAPGAPELAGLGRASCCAPQALPVQDVPDRGLDHGAYVPLVEMYPDADVPVLQVSMPTLEPAQLMDIGRRLAPLRDEGVLIVGSGFFTHNLRALSQDGKVALGDVRVRRLGPPRAGRRRRRRPARLREQGPGRQLAHPRTEHFAPAVRDAGRRGGGAWDRSGR